MTVGTGIFALESKSMWIFGYGSLMEDGWEKEFACLRRERAALTGYERSFSKASTLNWGSKDDPAPTLRVVPREGAVCRGIAFEFETSREDAVIAYLSKREGQSFWRRQVKLTLDAGQAVQGCCFFYEGKNLIQATNVEEVAAMVLRARGRDGSALDYLRNTKDAVDRMGFRDEAVETLWAAVLQMQKS
ncbi:MULTISPECIES: gamma-glutamylcyclotransferase [Rhizobium/Agrobacterium group]|uniref:gamma-glutamylcyclotransferase n=1 Tax=Rhizobium/Agrobacterium group TaxID=227290 RepID=UPI001F291DCE|nr:MULTISPECIES: gamma-glutamylcyclotransferase [Rhizobium/Agrobacterium group]